MFAPTRFGTLMEYQNRGPWHYHGVIWAIIFLKDTIASRRICDSMQQSFLLPLCGRISPCKFGHPSFAATSGTAILCHSVAVSMSSDLV
jgi:hypothetical protein